MRTMIERRLGWLALLVLAGIAGACAPPESGETVEFRVPVVAEEVSRGVVEDLIVTTGTLEARESVIVRAESTGFLTCGHRPDGRRLAEGDRLEAGQVLATISGEDVRLAAGSEAAQKRYDSSLRVLEARQELYDSGLISEVELRETETEVAQAKLEWERSRHTETRTVLETPIDGVLLRLARDTDGRVVADGQRVEPGFAVAQIAPTDRLIAEVDLVGPDLARVRPGLTARVRYLAFEGETFDGRLLRVAPTLDPVRRTARGEVEVENPAGELLPGMFVEVTLVAERREDVPVVPREAVTERGGTYVVFVLDGQRVTRREVVLGLGDDDVVEIRDGVDVAERVVVRGLETLTDGTRVRVTKG